MHLVQSYLSLALLHLDGGDIPSAFRYLVAARAEAKNLKGMKAHRIAVHCVVAMQAILPEAVDYVMYQLDESAPYVS